MTREKEEMAKARLAQQLKIACYTAAMAFMQTAYNKGRSNLKIGEFDIRLGEGIKNPLTGKVEPIIDETAGHVDHKRGRVSYAIVPMTDAGGVFTGQFRINFTGYGEDGKPAADVEIVLDQISNFRTNHGGGIH